MKKKKDNQITKIKERSSLHCQWLPMVRSIEPDDMLLNLSSTIYLNFWVKRPFNMVLE